MPLPGRTRERTPRASRSPGPRPRPGADGDDHKRDEQQRGRCPSSHCASPSNVPTLPGYPKHDPVGVGRSNAGA